MLGTIGLLVEYKKIVHVWSQNATYSLTLCEKSETMNVNKRAECQNIQCHNKFMQARQAHINTVFPLVLVINI